MNYEPPSVSQAASRPSASFASIIRAATRDAAVTVTATGVSLGGVVLPSGPAAHKIGLLVQAGVQVTATTVRELLLSGVINRLYVDGNRIYARNQAGDFRRVPSLDAAIQASMLATLQASKRTGLVFVTRNQAGHLRGILEDQSSVPLEGVCEQLVEEGAFYRCYVKEVNLASGVAPYVVPMHFAEVEPTSEEVLAKFDGKLFGAGEAAMIRHNNKLAMAAVKVEEAKATEQANVDALASLKAGGKITLGF